MNGFIRPIIEQQEMMQRLMEGPAKYFRENEATITRMRDLAHSMGWQRQQDLIQHRLAPAICLRRRADRLPRGDRDGVSPGPGASCIKCATPYPASATRTAKQWPPT